MWQYISPVTSAGIAPQGTNISNNTVFRAYRYSTDFPAFEGRDLTPQGPIELNPLPSSCVLTSVNEVIDNNEITILENPVRDLLTIKNLNVEKLQIDVFDLTGQLVESWQTDDQTIEEDVSAWGGGIYFIRIYIVEKNVFFTEKIIKQN